MTKDRKMNEEKIEEILLKNCFKKVSVLGPIALKFKQSKKETRMKEESYFTDTTMNGNTAHLIFEDMRAGKKHFSNVLWITLNIIKSMTLC